MCYLGLCLGILACLGPTLTFVGVNATWFSHRQIIFSAILSSLLGLAAGFALGQLPPYLAGAGGMLLFLAMSERLVHGLIQSTAGEVALVVFLTACGSILSLYSGLIALCLCLLLYTCFSFHDVIKSWHFPKDNLFSLKNFKRAKNTRLADEDTFTPVTLTKKNNIYILFLESVHSAEALQRNFSSNDAGLSDFLQEKGFTVLHDTYSNECTTVYSINSLLHMTANGHHVEDRPPQAFLHLWENGYNIQLFDTYTLTFGKYIKYADYYNARCPSIIAKIYEYFCPFFLQSKIINCLTLNIDPFSDATDFFGVEKDFKKRVAKKYASPQCYILRFGANHSDVTYSWKQRKKFVDGYLALYREAVSQIQRITEYIIRQDSSACIVAMGDHGSWSYRGAWHASDPNEEMRKNGLEPVQITLDLAGILCAVRPPDALSVAISSISPCNLFRLIFSLLGDTDVPYVKNETYLPGYWCNNAEYTYYGLVKDGIPLEDWEQIQSDRAYDKNASFLQECSERVRQHESNGDIFGAIALLEKSLAKQDNYYLREYLAALYLRAGKAKDCLLLLSPAMNDTATPILVIYLPHYLSSLILCGDKNKSFFFFKTSPLVRSLPETRRIRLNAEMYHISGELHAAAKTFTPLIKHPPRNLEQLEQQRVYTQLRALYVDADGRTDEAVRQLDAFYEKSPFRQRTQAFAGLFCYSAGLSLRLGDWADSERRLRWILAEIKPAYPATLQLWLAGTLERQDRIEEAQSLHEQVYAQSREVPYLGAQLGMFYLRRQIASPRFPEAQKEALAYLDATEERLAPFFDAAWYKRTHRERITADGLEPLRHFVHYWRVLGLDPNPFFNTVFYRLYYNPIFKEGDDLIWHFLSQKPYQWFDPSLNFSTIAYISRHNDVDWTHVHPLVHKLQATNV